MSENCNKFEWTFEAPARDEKHLPLRQADRIPPIHVKPKPGISITRLSISTSEPFQSNQTPENATAAVDGAYITIRTASLRENCILHVSYSADSQHSDEKCIIEIPTRVPIHVPGPNSHWKASDIKLERRVTPASGGNDDTVSGLATKIKSTKETIIWLEGDPGSGKTTFIKELHTIIENPGKADDQTTGNKQAHWCVVVLDGQRLYESSIKANGDMATLRNKVIGEFLKELNQFSPLTSVTDVAALNIRDDNWEEALDGAVSHHQEERLLLIFEEFDAFFQGVGANAFEILKHLRNDVIRRFSDSAKGGILIVVDQVAPSNRDITKPAAQLKPFQHWKLCDYFTLKEVKDILGQLTPHTSYDAVANRIWMWTRGQPTLVNSLILQYIEHAIKSLSGGHEYTSQPSDAIIDLLAYSDETRAHVAYLVDVKHCSNGSPLKRLPDEEQEIIKSLNAGSAKIPGDDKHLSSLIAKGIVKETRLPTGEVSHRIPIPLIRLHLDKRPQQVG